MKTTQTNSDEGRCGYPGCEAFVTTLEGLEDRCDSHAETALLEHNPGQQVEEV